MTIERIKYPTEGTPSSMPGYLPEQTHRQKMKRERFSPPIMDGSDQVPVVEVVSAPANSLWGLLLRTAIITIIVVTLVTILLHGEIARQRYQWKRELQGYEKKRAVYEKEMRALVAATKKLAAEKAELDKWNEQLVARRRQIKWINATDAGCSAYAKRRHTAILSNIAPGLNPEKECLERALKINGKLLPPTTCEAEKSSGRMMGVWDVASAQCKARVSKQEDRGCYKPGGRHFKGLIADVQDHEDFIKICYTMPGGVAQTQDGRSLTLGEPEYCYSECITKDGIFGRGVKMAAQVMGLPVDVLSEPDVKCSYMYWARWSAVDSACS